MTHSQHTPGPWTVRDDERDWAIIGPEPSWIAGFDKRNHNAAANARLIAAAPELLAALEHSHQFVLAWLPEYANRPNNRDQYKRIDAALQKIDAAIAKARGQS